MIRRLSRASLAVAAVSFSASFAAMPPAAAQACRIAPKAGEGWSAFIEIGSVSEFGDLRIRQIDLAPDALVVDAKAPGFLQTGVRLVAYKPVKFVICGQDVTITFNSKLTVGVF